ncbi:hypothetical protein HL653_05810 [Sphingomonas sp. AP4-R1]|uniref:hypothetical protein n=1 Tax=Sphingomonas sp. AP4-R1 TaxID=2735134 RepID=UPI0014933CB7|nr:hypothetical protein [Sphingomonas sp. AP4-R1]QJU57370.1 hypothetical protein HL653_05810 [Sphingomonas sp. AP4-R1]
MHRSFFVGIAFLLGMASLPAHAGLLDGLGTCTLTVNASGTMRLAGDGKTLSTTATGGLSAGMLLVGVNITPELVFSAPTVVGPTGWPGSPKTEISIDTLSGTRTGFTSNAITVRPGVLIDTLTFQARVTNNDGFKAGNYTVNTTATCQSAT